ncbi:MAG: hypothetical protein NTV06_07880 [candidate division Zixibacteria bacterium]|nr:hypothetical protein [candidate division Zixibacteria bacterium]
MLRLINLKNGIATILIIGILAGLIVALVVISGCSSKKTAGKDVKMGIENFYGVWANENCELIRTARYSLLFERQKNKITVCLERFDIKNDTIIFDTRGMAIFDTTKKQVDIKAKDLIAGDELLVDSDSSRTIELPKHPCTIENRHDKLTIQCEGGKREELSIKSKNLKLKTSSGTWQELKLIEKIRPTSPYEMPAVSKDNIGICLQSWSLGTVFNRNNDQYVVGVTINTNRHAYVFYFNGMIYCRAARIRSNNNGSVFAQNIRLMSKTGEFTAYMPDNNLLVTEKSVAINDSVFNPKMCIFANADIYWSLKSFGENSIILNGCGGEDYHYERPRQDSSQLLEWFAYEEYED